MTTLGNKNVRLGISALALMAAYVSNYGLPERDDSYAQLRLGAYIGAFIGMYCAMNNEIDFDETIKNISNPKSKEIIGNTHNNNFVMFVPAEEVFAHTLRQTCLKP